MNRKTARYVFATGMFTSLTLAGCGGGGETPACFEPGVPGSCVFLPPSGPTGGTGPLFTTAPSAVTLDAGSDATYQLSGGTGRFTATSGNTNVVRPTLSGNVLTLTAVSAGTTQVSVVDTVGDRVGIAVTVLAQGAAGSPLSLTPGSLTIGNCTTRIPFIFRGGSGPFTVFSSDNFNVPVTSALPLPDGRHYFFADVRYAAAPQDGVGDAVLTVLDSQSRSAVTHITTPLDPFAPCATPTLLTVSPESANFRASEVLSFQLSAAGRPLTTAPTVRFAESGVAEVIGVTASMVTVQAARNLTTARSTLMIVEGPNGQRATVVISVQPQPSLPQ